MTPAGRIQVAIHGAEGRMGRLVTDLVEADAGIELVGLITEAGRAQKAGAFHARLPLIAQDRMTECLMAGCVLIDFSLASALESLLAQAAVLSAPIVSGTTGFDGRQQDLLAVHAERLPVVHATNFSVGIPALQMVLQLLARTLPSGFDVAQVETHHATKIDRPSGTARTLADAWTKARGGDAVPTESQRLGGIIGEHTWTLADAEETLVVTHRAQSRRAFLRGVLPAVRFVAGRTDGLYNLTDVLRAGAPEGA